MKNLFVYINAFSGVGGLQQFNRNFMQAAGENSNDPLTCLALRDQHADLPVSGYTRFYTANNNVIIFIWKTLFFGSASDQVIIGHVNLIFPLACLLKWTGRKKKLILITHGIEIWRPLSFWKRKSIEWFTDEIITVSNYTKQRILNQLQYRPDAITILPNTLTKAFTDRIGLADPAYIRERFNLPPDSIIMLTVCRIATGERHKGYDTIIGMMPDLLTQIPALVYILAGKIDTDEYLRLQQQIKKTGLEEKVLLTGFVEDINLPDLYCSSDFFIMPSQKEGFGIVFIEAMACGTPVIAGNKDGSPDALLQGELGILIDPDDAMEIKQAICQLVTKSAAMRIANKKFLQEKTLAHFGIKAFNKRVQTIIQQK